MSLDELIETIRKIDQAQDTLAMDAVAQLLLIHHIPYNEGITVAALIDKVVNSFVAVRESTPYFDFALWTQNTVIECIDFFITCGNMYGPSVDMNTESHVLIESVISRTDNMDDYIVELEKEIECYAPAPSGREKS